MKKYFYMILSAIVLTMGFTSCIDEEGAGTPSLKKMHLQTYEFTYDLRSDKAQSYTEKLAEFESSSLIIRWIDVTNATYTLSFTNPLNTEVKWENLEIEQVPGDLSTLSAEFTHRQILNYIETAGIWQDQFETHKDENGKDISVRFQVATVNINVTGTPIDVNNTALAPEGSTATAVVTIYRDKLS